MLRPYQTELIENLRQAIRDGNRRIIAVLPTGGGKTYTFTHIVKGALDNGRKTLILTDRIELLKQAGGALDTYGLQPIEVKAGRKPYLGGVLYTAMVETLARRLDKKDYQHWLQQMEIIIIDEAHMRSFDKIFPFLHDNARVLGFTATPRREGKKNQLGQFYHHLVEGVEIQFLVESGFLAEPMYYGVEADLSGVRTKAGDYDQNQVADRFSQTKLYKGVVDNWRKIAPNTKTLIFSSNIASSLELVHEFEATHKQVRHLDSTMGNLEREQILKWFNRTPDAVLSNVGILTKGFDEPSIQTVVLYRATQSVPLYLQMVGRGSRIAPGKDTFNILDFGGNIARHGFWHEPRTWSLTVKPDTSEKKGDALLKICKNTTCEMFIPIQVVECPHCGFIDQKEKEEQEFARLTLLNPHELRNMAEGKTLEEKAEMARKKLIKPSWVLHNLKDWEEVKEFVRLMGYNPYWFQYNHSRFWWSAEYIEEVNSGKRILKIV